MGYDKPIDKRKVNLITLDLTYGVKWFKPSEYSIICMKRIYKNHKYKSTYFKNGINK